MQTRLIQRLFLFLIFLRATAFWFAWAIFRKDIPFSVAMIYRERGQDIEYFPYVAGLLTHGFKDAYDYAFQGSGVLSFPFGSVMLHAVLFKTLGIVGFVLADFIVAAVSYLLLVTLFKEFKIKPIIAQVLSLLMVIGAAGKLAGISAAVMQRTSEMGMQVLIGISLLALVIEAIKKYRGQKNSPLIFFGGIALAVFAGAHANWEFFTWRFPRPFVSGVYFLSFLVLLAKMLWQENIFNKKLHWALLGCAASGLLQADVYTFVYCGLLCITLVAIQLYQKFDFKEGVKSLASFIAPFLVCSVPFIFQRLHENPEVPRRFGIYAISRLHPYFLEPSFFDLVPLILGGLLLVILFSKTNESQTTKRTSGAVFAFLIFSFFLMPLFLIITGKVILPGHFYDQFRHVSTLSIIFLIGLVLTKTLKIKSEKSPVWVVGLIFSVGLVNIAKDTHKTMQYDDHTRSDFKEYSGLPNYQKNFVELVKLLQTDAISPELSLSTFDMQVSIWWMTFKHGKNFISDTFSSSLSDEYLENRLLIQGKILSLTEDEMIEFLKFRMTHIFFFTGCKYQYNKGHAYSSLDDYLPEDQERYEKTSPMSSFSIALPISEQKRLREKYRNTAIPEKKDLPDLIVLHSFELLNSKSADAALYEQIFANDVFRVWKKR